MKQAIISRLNSFQQRTGFQWGGGELILAGILVIGILSLGSGMFGRWLRASREGGLLMVDLHSFSSADYGVDEMPVSVPVIGLEIIQDLLGMKGPPETGRPAQIALVTPGMPTPTPTLPWSGTFPGTSTPEITDPEESTATNEPRNTSTPVVNRSPTPTPTPLLPDVTDPPPNTARPSASPTASAPTSTPKPTKVPPTIIPATNTPMPTQQPPTDTPVPTQQPPINTPVPTQQPPTNTPQPSLPPQPAVSPTPRPTRSSTLAVTPTAKYTPAVTSGPPPLP